MRSLRVLLVSIVLVAGFPATPVHAAIQRVGPDLTTAAAPAANCGGQTCSAVQMDGAGATEVPAAGTITRFRLRHGTVPGGLMTTEVRLAVYSRSGSSFTVVRESGAVTVPPTQANDQTDTFSVSVPVAAGQYLGVRVISAWAGNDAELKVVGTGGSADTVGRYVGNHAGGAATYAPVPGAVLLFNADLETGAAGGGGTGGGTGGTGGGTGGTGGETGGGTGGTGGGTGGETGGTGGGASAVCPTSAGKVAHPTVRSTSSPGSRGNIRVTKGSGGWRGGAVLRNDKFLDEASVVYDRKGRRHVAGRGAAHHDVYYAGPSGRRRVFDSAWGGGASLAIDAKNRPVVGYGDSEPRSGGPQLAWCARLRAQTGTGSHTTVRALTDGGEGFDYVEFTNDPRGGAVHTAYNVGEQLFYQRVGGVPARLPANQPRVVRIAAGGGAVAIGALNDSGLLVVFHRTGTTGAFAKRVISRGASHYDLAMGSDGTPKVAFAKRGRLHVFNGRRIVSSDIPAYRVGLATDAAKRLHVAFSPSNDPNCYGNVVAVWCTNRNGVFHLRLNEAGTTGRWTSVQGSVGYSPARFSVATYRNRTAIAYGNPANNGYLTVRTKTF